MNSVYKLLIQITGKDKGAKRELDKTKKSVKGLGDQVKGLQGAFVAAGATMAFYFTKQIAETVWEMGRMGAEALRMGTSFDKLAGRIDTTGDALLSSLRAAAGGTVSDMELMRTTAGLLASGIQTSTADITDAMEIARLKAQQFGLTTTEAYNRMVTGARKFSVEMLDEIGINLRAESVYKRKADTMGIAVKALTDAQKAESLWQAILQDGRAEIEQYGGAVDDMATDIEQASVAIENASLAAQIAMAPMVAGIAEMVPGAIARLELLGAVFEGIISLQEYYTAAGQAQRIEQEHGIHAAEGYAAAVIMTGGAILQTGNAQRDWTIYLDESSEALGEAGSEAQETGVAIGTLGGVFQNSRPAVLDYAKALHEVSSALEEVRKDAAAVTVDELGAGFAGAVGRIESQLAGLAGDVSFTALQDIRRRYVNEVDALFREIADAYAEGTEMTDFELEYRLNLIMGRFDEEVDVLENAALEVGRGIDSVSDAYDDLRSAVESALTPTTVTAFDMSLSAMGQYVDKWDENARRLDAVAEAGFAAFDAHPDWVEILKIPDNVLAGGEEGLKSWAAQTAAGVRDLTRPDLLNIDAAVAAVEQYFADMAARELSIDLVTQALVEKGVVSGADAKKEVAQALGLDQTTVGEDAGKQIFDGMIEKFSEKSAAAEFAGYLKEDTVQQAVVLKGAGRELWYTTEAGILAAMEEGTYVLKWVDILLPALLNALGAQGQWSGEGEP